MSGLDTERILRVLEAHQIDYLMIGGLAALAYGSTIATADLDVLPSVDHANLTRLLAALRELNAHILVSETRLAAEAGEIWEAVALNQDGAAALVAEQAWHFTTSAGPIDVVISLTGLGPFDALAPNCEHRQAFGVTVAVAGLDDLIRSKEATNRPKDEAILRELRELRKLRPTN